MANIKIGNTVMDMLNIHELHASLTQHQANYFQEVARGLKHININPVLGTAANSAISLPAPGDACGPKTGFAWDLRRISAYGLASGDVIQVFKNSTDGSGFVGQITFANPVLLLDKQCILLGGQRLYFQSTGTLTATQVIINGEADECSEIDIWKIIGGH